MSEMKKYFDEGVISLEQYEILKQYSMLISKNMFEIRNKKYCMNIMFNEFKFIGVYETIKMEEDFYKNKAKYIYCFLDTTNNSIIKLAEKNLQKKLNSNKSLYDLIDALKCYKNKASETIDQILCATKHKDDDDVNKLLQMILDLKYTDYDLLEPNVNLLYYGFGVTKMIKNNILKIIEWDKQRCLYNKTIEENEEFIVNMFILQTTDLSKYPDKLSKKLKSFFEYRSQHGFLTEKMVYAINKIGSMNVEKIDTLIDIIAKLPCEKFIKFNDYNEEYVFQDLVESYRDNGLTEKQVNVLERIYNKHKKYFESEGLTYNEQ